MPNINPSILKKFRDREDWTLDQLSQESGVSKGSINKIETGRRTKVRHKTVERLARALKISPEVLQGNASDDDVSRLNLSNLSKSELKVILDDRCRNALHLVSWRYRMTPEAIVNLAPFLFFWAAEKSLRVRRDALKQIGAKFEEIDLIRKASLPHIGFRIGENMVSEEIAGLEAQSINNRDLFGRIVEEESDDIVQAVREDFDESEHNPFTGFLQTLAAETPDMAQFDWMWSSGSPRYEICRDVAMKLVDGDETAAEYILSGRAPLHLLPKELREQDRARDRAAWAKVEAQKRPTLDLDDFL